MADPADVQLLTVLLIEPRRRELGRRLEREFYRRGWPTLKYAGFRDADHPRGQPDNAGQFVSDDKPAARQRGFSERKRKPGLARGGNGDQGGESSAADAGRGRRELLSAVKNDFSNWLSPFARHFPERAAHYEATAHEVLGTMNAKAILMFRTVVHGAKFYTDLKTLNDSLPEHAPRDKKQLLGGLADPQAHRLHLDGGSDTGEPILATCKDIYAHEFYHAVDMASGYSSTDEWNLIYRQEIQGDQLSRRADVDSAEGFAEFGRMVVRDPREAEHSFPRAWSFLKQQGLI